MRKLDYILNNALGLAFALVLLAVVLSLASCKTIKVVPEIHTEYVHDTISRVDSIYRSHYITMKGDTIWQRDTIYEYRWRDKVVEVLKTDSIPYEVEVKEYVTQNSKFAKFCIWHTIIVWLTILLAAAIWCAKKFYGH